MFSEEELREAAAEYNAAMVKAVLRDYDPEQQHVFSPGYERKIRRLKRRADHPVFYRVLRSAAALLLSLLIGGGALLAVSPTARAAFVGWVKEVWGEFFVYHFDGNDTHANSADNSETATAPVHYRPTWLPEGYTEAWIDSDKETIFVVYANDSGMLIKFNYTQTPDEVSWFLKASETSPQSITISKNGPAELLISNDPEISSTITWISANKTGFFISGHLNQDELIQIAESVKEFN